MQKVYARLSLTRYQHVKSFILKVASGIYGVFDTKYKGLYEDLHEVLYEQKESHDLAL